MGLNSAFTDKQFLSDFAIAHSPSNQFEDLEFAFRYTEVFQSLFVQGKRLRGCRYLFDDDNFLLACQFEAEPDSNTRKQERDQAAIDLDRVFHNKDTKLDHLERDDQHAGEKAVDEHVKQCLPLSHGVHNNHPYVS